MHPTYVNTPSFPDSFLKEAEVKAFFLKERDESKDCMGGIPPSKTVHWTFSLKNKKVLLWRLTKSKKKKLSSQVSHERIFMATVSQLLAKLKTLQYKDKNGKVTNDFTDAAKMIEITYRSQAYTLLEKSVTEAAAVGISIELKGLGNLAGGYSYVDGADIYMPTVPAHASYPPMDIMTYFLFETRNATRAIKTCELRRKAALNQIASNSYVYFMGEYEARGGLELGEMWNALILEKKITKEGLSRFARYCYNDLYLMFPSWRTDSKKLGEAIEAVLKTSYASGGTRRDAYASEFTDFNTKPIYKDPQSKATCTGASLNKP